MDATEIRNLAELALLDAHRAYESAPPERQWDALLRMEEAALAFRVAREREATEEEFALMRRDEQNCDCHMCELGGALLAAGGGQ